jgi:hypothetical protein
VHMCNNLVILDFDIGIKLLSLDHLMRKRSSW